MKKIRLFCSAAAAAIMLSGCAGAAFNRVDLKTVRNVSVGRELMDLQEAHDKGVISDTEYSQAKQNILNILNQLDGIELNNK